jgi:hypothetical protein
MTDTPTADEIAAHYTAIGHSVALITDVIAGNTLANKSAAERQDVVDRNTQHLEVMVAKDYWTDESMTATNAAVTAGNGYTAS